MPQPSQRGFITEPLSLRWKGFCPICVIHRNGHQESPIKPTTSMDGVNLPCSLFGYAVADIPFCPATAITQARELLAVIASWVGIVNHFHHVQSPRYHWNRLNTPASRSLTAQVVGESKPKFFHQDEPAKERGTHFPQGHPVPSSFFFMYITISAGHTRFTMSQTMTGYKHIDSQKW